VSSHRNAYHSFTGNSTIVQGRGRGDGQPAQRGNIRPYDQHGRRWWASTEHRSNMPTGQLAPEFKAPWIPDQQYLKVNPNDTSQVYIDYPEMYRDRRTALREYHALAVRLATEKSWPIPEFGKYTSQYTDKLGRPPRAIECVAAAAQGNPWILGFTQVPDPRLKPYIENPTTVLHEMEEAYDFSEASYASVVAELAPAREAVRQAIRQTLPETLPGEPLSVDDLEAAADELDDEAEDAFDALGSVDEDDELFDLEDEADAGAFGGKTVKPANAEKAQRQAPRRPTQTSVTRKRGAEASASGKSVNRPFRREGRRSLADGATPAISPE
jgi:hypothetical protein